MDIRVSVREGEPFKGNHLNKLISFLKEYNLQYDAGISYSVVLETEDEIVGTGSIQGNVLKCIAVSEKFQGMGVMAGIITQLLKRLANQGIKHFFVFTKPKNQKKFEDMAFYPIICTKDVLQEISASYARKLIKNKKFIELQEYIPVTTMKYIETIMR